MTADAASEAPACVMGGVSDRTEPPGTPSSSVSVSIVSFTDHPTNPCGRLPQRPRHTNPSINDTYLDTKDRSSEYDARCPVQ